MAISPAVGGAALSHALFFSSYRYFKDLFGASSASSFGLSSVREREPCRISGPRFVFDEADCSRSKS